jgi:hypothetical protein
MIKRFKPAPAPLAQETDTDRDLFQVLDIERQLQPLGNISDKLIFTAHFFTVSPERAMRISWRAKQLGFEHIELSENCTCGEGPGGMIHVIIGLHIGELPTVRLIQAARSAAPDLFYHWDVGTFEVPSIKDILQELLPNLKSVSVLDLDDDLLEKVARSRRKSDPPLS